MASKEDKLFEMIMAAAASGRMMTDEEVAMIEAVMSGKPVHEPMPADIRPIDVDVAPGEVTVDAAPEASTEAEDLLKGVYEPAPRKMYSGSGLSKTDVFGRKAVGHSASSVWMDAIGGGWWDDKQDQQESLGAALRAVQRAANVLQNSDGDERQIDAKWSDGKKVNRAGDPTVWLSPDIPIKESSLRDDWSDAERNDVLVAEALAESAMKRTMDPVTEDKMARAGRSKSARRTAARVWTAAERIAAEEEVARDYPGFRSYFAAHRQYFTSDQAWQQLSDMVREAKDKIPVSLAARVFQWELLHPEEPIEMPKVLRDELSEAHKLMGQATSSQERGAAAESIRDRFEAAFVADKDDDDDGDGGDKKKPGPGDVEIGMPYEYRGEKVENESKADGLPGDGTMQDLRDWKGGTDQIRVKPSKQYGGLVAGLRGRIRALMAQLKLRNEAKRMDEHGLKRGRLDEGSIYKLGFTSCGFADEGLFEQEEVKETPDIAVGLLVDESGSMNGENIQQARALAIMLAEALAGLKGVHFCVMGHSGQGQVHGKMCEGLALSHYFTPDNPHMSSMARIAAFSQNLDGYAIAEVAKNVLRWYPKCQTKLVIHLSDGQPSANGYGGPSAMAHMGEVSAKARRDGIQVLGIGVQAFNEEEGTRMYGPRNFVIVQSMAQSVLAISKLVRDAVLRDTL